MVTFTEVVAESVRLSVEQVGELALATKTTYLSGARVGGTVPTIQGWRRGGHVGGKTYKIKFEIN